MRLVRMNGGLGNQVFQYVFMRYIEEKTGQPCIIEDTEFHNYLNDNPVYNGYQLEKIFGIKHKTLSEALGKDVFEELTRLSRLPLREGGKKRGIVPVFKEMGVDLLTVQEKGMIELECGYSGNLFSVPMNEFYPDVVRCEGNIYYYGYWINPHWFNSIALKMLEELTFPEIPDEKNSQYMKQIKAANESSVAVHVRRGDFVTLGRAIDTSVYHNMINAIREKIEKPVFFVFSDDIAWVREHAEEHGFLPADEIIFVEGNFRETSYIDMQLMKECRGMIFSSSSFSYLAALLNTRKDKIVLQTTGRQMIYYN